MVLLSPNFCGAMEMEGVGGGGGDGGGAEGGGGQVGGGGGGGRPGVQQVYGSTREGTLVAAERREAAKAYFPSMAEKGHNKR